uniref:Uncharacterized protein n=1 Tax=Anopheles culicifacies TaxID=139723 RepID=A0A182MW11_9DIPT
MYCKSVLPGTPKRSFHVQNDTLEQILALFVYIVLRERRAEFVTVEKIVDFHRHLTRVGQYGDDGNVKESTAKRTYQHELFTDKLFVNPDGNGGRCRFVDESQHSQPSNGGRIQYGLTLSVRKLRRYGYDSTCRRNTKLPFGHRTQMCEYNAADLLRIVTFRFALESHLQTTFLFVTTQNPFHLYHTINRINVSLRKSFFSHESTFLGKRNHRRYGSPHHSRSQSVKTPGSRASGRPNQLCLPQQRSSTEHLTPAAGAVAAGSARTSATCSLASSRESSTSNPASGPYKVLMLGGPAVGKSSLVSQFMTSEYLHAYDTSIDDDSGEKTVSVLLSGEESELTFIDHSYNEMAPENCMSTYDPHGYCVIYSSTDKETFLIAERVLQILWTTENIAQKAVILVANKADLARCRVVTSDEGKAMATQYDCKFIETSVGINHNVDELLVGLLSQIRLKLENPEKSRDLFRKRSIRKSKRRACSPLGGAICLAGIGGNTNPSTPVSGPPASGGGFVDTPPGSAHSSPRKYRGSRTSASLKVKGLLGRVWARDSKSKSCENLHVL